MHGDKIDGDWIEIYTDRSPKSYDLAGFARSLLPQLSLRGGEGGFIGLESSRILVGNEITFRRAVGTLDTFEIARDKLLGEEERHFALFRLAVAVDFQRAG